MTEASVIAKFEGGSDHEQRGTPGPDLAVAQSGFLLNDGTKVGVLLTETRRAGY